MPSTAPRTLADQLRGWPDAAVARLLAARPDLLAPTPQDSAQLASRAVARASVLRALDQLTLLELAVLDAVVALGGSCAPEAVVAAVHAPAEDSADALDRLRALVLVWGGPDRVRAPGAVAELVGTALSGLGPAAATLLAGYGPARVGALASDLGLVPTGDRARDVAAVVDALTDPGTVAGLVGQVSDQARAILDHLDRTGTVGAFDGAGGLVPAGEAAAPAEELLARGLVLARGRTHVVVPREVALCLRGGRTTRDPVGSPPELATTGRGRRLVDQAAAGAAHELVRNVELLVDHWGTHPPPALRAGGLGVRDLKAVAALLQVGEPVAALLVELAHAAGLVAKADTAELETAWLPTDAFDAFLAASPEDRWAGLGLAWLDSPRLVSLVGTREAGKPVNALQPELERSWLPTTRRQALEQLAGLAAGQVLAPGSGVPSLVARLRWLRPRRPPSRADAVVATVREAAVLGVCGLDGLSTHGRALLAGDPAHQVAAALRPLLPRPVDHVMVQADLTAVAPGPLEQQLARQLATVADVESRGGATVYRFTPASVRRAFDAGWTAVEVHDLLGRASRTPLPQPLTYLVDDVARTFGTLRVAAASSVVRSDDEAALAALALDPAAASLRLRRIAPTVLVTDVPVDVLLPRLRDLGRAPVVETVDGTIRLGRPRAHRVRQPRPHPAADDPRGLARASARVAATVTAIRAGDRATAHRPAAATRPASPAATMAALREAAESGGTVWIGYVDSDGSTLERVVDPQRVEGGWLRAFDHRTEGVRSFAIHRITAVGAVPA